MKTITSIFESFNSPLTQQWPRGLEGRLSEAAVVVEMAHSLCREQLGALRLGDDLRRHGEWERAESLRRHLDGNAVLAVERHIEALVLLDKARGEAIRQLQAMRGRIPAEDEEIQDTAARVIDWSEESPASELLRPCAAIAAWQTATATGPLRPHWRAWPDTTRFNGSDLRINARRHGACRLFLERTARLTYLPWMKTAAAGPPAQ